LNFTAAALALALTFGLANSSHASPGAAAPGHASPAAAAPVGEPSMMAKCSIPSLGVYRNLFKQAVVKDLTSKGYTASGVIVIMKASAPRTTIKLPNITNFKSLSLKADGSGYDLATTGDMSVGCVTSATVTIRGGYIIRATATTAATRKTFSSTQTVNIMGAFN
jgi:hypothetical protein